MAGQDTGIAASATDSMGTAAQVLRVRCQELDNGQYSVDFKILTASAALQFRLRVLNRVVFVKTVRLTAAARTQHKMHTVLSVLDAWGLRKPLGVWGPNGGRSLLILMWSPVWPWQAVGSLYVRKLTIAMICLPEGRGSSTASSLQANKPCSLSVFIGFLN